jgi:hypothetical protein
MRHDSTQRRQHSLVCEAASGLAEQCIRQGLDTSFGNAIVVGELVSIIIMEGLARPIVVNTDSELTRQTLVDGMILSLEYLYHREIISILITYVLSGFRTGTIESQEGWCGEGRGDEKSGVNERQKLDHGIPESKAGGRTSKSNSLNTLRTI